VLFVEFKEAAAKPSAEAGIGVGIGLS